MSEEFGKDYANTYDDIYQDKDYEQECKMLAGIFKKYGTSPVKSILDLGCGTGNHDIILARKEYSVIGADRSAEMIRIARKKAAAGKLPIEYHQADIRSLDLGKTFDAAVMMFAVFGYQLENKDAIAALDAARKHLTDGGLLVMDMWYGPAVLKQRPSDKVKIVKKQGETILRTSSGTLDVDRQLCTVSFNVWKFSGKKLLSETREDHQMRYFFRQELELLLDRSGFKLAAIGAFPDYNQPATEDTWNIIVIAKAARRRKQ